MARKTKEIFSYKAEAARLRDEGPEKLYLLYGEEDYLRQRYFELLLKTCLGDGDPDFNYKRLGGENLDLSRLSQAIDTVPFFAERSLVEVKDYDINKCRDSELQRLKDILGDIPDYCTVVFTESVDYSPDGRLSPVKLMQKLGRCINFTRQGEKDLCDWIIKRFAAGKKRISRQDAEYLIFTGGGLMNRLIPEIDKLSSGTAGDTVTRQDIDLMVQRLPEADVFEMTELMGAGNFDAAAGLLAQLLSRREEPIMLLALIGAQMRRLYGVRLAMTRSLSGAETMELCGIKYDFILQKLRQSAGRFSLGSLASILELCAEYDFKMKSSGGDSAELLKEFFARTAAMVTC